MNGAEVKSNSMMPSLELVSILTAEFLSPAQVAAALKVSRKTLADWRLKREGPPFTLAAHGVVLYPVERFVIFLRAQSQEECRKQRVAGEMRWSPAVMGQLTRREEKS